MATDAIVGIGAKLKYFDSLTSDYITLAEVNSISWDGPTREVVEVGGLNPTDEYINKLQGLLNANSVSANIRYTKAQYDQLKTFEETRGNQSWQIELPDGSGLEWDGFITELPLEVTESDPISGDVSIEIDGKADFVSI